MLPYMAGSSGILLLAGTLMSKPAKAWLALQEIGDVHILALLQQAQVQRAAQEALQSLEEQSLQAEAVSEQKQELALQVGRACCLMTHYVSMHCLCTVVVLHAL